MENNSESTIAAIFLILQLLLPIWARYRLRSNMPLEETEKDVLNTIDSLGWIHSLENLRDSANYLTSDDAKQKFSELFKNLCDILADAINSTDNSEEKIPQPKPSVMVGKDSVTADSQSDAALVARIGLMPEPARQEVRQRSLSVDSARPKFAPFKGQCA